MQLGPTRSRIAGVLLAVSGCAAPGPSGAGRDPAASPAGAATDAAVLGQDCPDDTVLDPEHGCVATACGVGTWGDLETGAFDWFVQADAPDGGDGSIDAPFRTIAEAIAVLGPVGSIAVAAGTYPEFVAFELVEDVTFAGRCRDLVHITPPDAELGGTFALKLWAPGGRGLFRGVSVRGRGSGGISASQGALTVEDVEVYDTLNFGIVAIGEDEPMIVRRARLVDTPAYEEWTGGTGALMATPHTRMLAEDIEIIRPYGIGAYAMAGELVVEDLVVRDVRASHTPEATAIQAYNGGVLDCTRCTVEGSLGYGVQSRDYSDPEALSRVILRDSVLRDIDGRVTNEEEFATALYARFGGQIELEDVTIDQVGGNAMVAYADEAAISGTGVTVTGIRAPEHLDPGGVAVARAVVGGEIALSDVALTDIEGWIAVATEPGTRISLDGLVSEGTGVPDVLGDAQTGAFAGGGLSVADGAVVTASELVLHDTGGPAFVVRDATLEVSGWRVDGVTANTPSTVEAVFAGPALLANHATVRLSDGAVAGTIGWSLLQAGGSLTLDDVAFEGTAAPELQPQSRDIVISDGTTLTASGVHFISPAATAVAVEGPDTRATFDLSTWEPSAGAGAIATDGASLAIRESTLTGRSIVGVAADGVGSELSLVRTSITDTRDGTRARYAVGVGILGGANGTLDAVDIADTAGVGLLVSAATATGTGGTITRSEGVGVYALDATLELQESAVHDTVEVSGQGGYGIFGDDSAVSLDAVTTTGHPTVGVWARGARSRWTVTDSALHGGPTWPLRAGIEIHGDALVASGGVPADGLVLTDTHLADAAGAGLLLQGAAATVDGVTWADNAVDVVRQGCDDAAAPLGDLTQVTTDWCPDGERLVLDPDLSFFVDLGDVLDE